ARVGAIQSAVLRGSALGSNDILTISIYNADAITQATYAGNILVDQDHYEAALSYQSGGVTRVSNTAGPSDVVVVVTQITPLGFRGTFQGTVKAAGASDITITDGTFFVKRSL